MNSMGSNMGEDMKDSVTEYIISDVKSNRGNKDKSKKQVTIK